MNTELVRKYALGMLATIRESTKLDSGEYKTLLRAQGEGAFTDPDGKYVSGQLLLEFAAPFETKPGDEIFVTLNLLVAEPEPEKVNA